MASSDQDVESLLSSKTSTPMAQLNPELTDQATRKIHGEVTITWPYSSITKSFAFLLAEPDFRLRRDKGLVRIQLKGPSAEAAEKWELGSGDEVTLALDGVEWAKDDEPVRPAGSRCEWQLQFAGKLTLKATLSDTQETKSLNIDQPISLGAPEASHPIHFAEIDLTIFDNDPIKDEAPTSSISRAAANEGEYASPFFMKRSRASYGPMFDFEELEEEDGGRSSKRHKGLHYAAVNGRWRVQEGSRSPTPESEPELVKDSLAAAREHSGDVKMHDTPSKSGRTDEGVQTDEVDLVLGSSSPINTPSKGWSKPGTTKSSGQGVGLSFDDSKTSASIQASLAKNPDPVAVEPHGSAPVQATPNPFGQAFPSSKFNGFGGSTPAFGAPAEHREHVASRATPAFSGQTFGSTGGARFGQSQGPSNNPIGQMPSPFSSNPIMASNTGLGQTSSLFGTAHAPRQSPFLPSPSVNTGFGAPSGSVRFGFGHRSPSPSAAPAFGAAQITQDSMDPYPESSLEQQGASTRAPNISQNPFGTTLEEPHDSHRFGDYQAPTNQMAEQQTPIWPLGTQNFDPSHAAGHIIATEDIRSSGNSLRNTSPGMVPPAVNDGTRNLDEMRHAGILSGSVYRQGVPQEALPDHGDASAGEDNESMDTDERLDYDEVEKGDDYDLRNYDRVSDDEEDFEDEEALSDEELLDQASEHWVGPASEDEAEGWAYDRGQDGELEDGMQGHDLEEELQAELEKSRKEHPDGESDEDEDEDEDDYEYDDEEVPHQAPRYPSSFHAPAPSIPKQPIEVIDLLSDSEDDEPPKSPVQAPSNQLVQERSAEPSKVEATGSPKNELEEQNDGQVHTGQMLAPHASHPNSGTRQDATGFDEEADSSGNDGDEFYDEDEDGEDEPEADIKESRRATEPVFDMSESSDRDEDETEVYETIAVNRAQQNGITGPMPVDEDQRSVASEGEGKKDETEVQDPVTANTDPTMVDTALSNRADDAIAVDEERETRLSASEDEHIGEAEGHDVVKVSEMQPGSGDDNMVANKDRESDLAEMASVHEQQTEVQGDSDIDQVQLGDGDNAVAVGDEQQSNPADAEDSQAEANQAEAHDAIAANDAQHHIVEESMSAGGEAIQDLADSLQSHTDYMLTSFGSHHTVATTLSSASQGQEDGDVDMKDSIAQETPQSVALESAAVGQDSENGTEQPQSEAEGKISEDIPAEDDMVVEAQQVSVSEFKKNWTVELSSDDDRVEARSPTTSQPQDFINTGLTAEVATTVTNQVEAQLDDHQDDTSGDQGTELKEDVGPSQPLDEESSSQKRTALEYQKVQSEAEPVIPPSMEVDETHKSITESRDVGTVDGVLASQGEDDLRQADAAPTPTMQSTEPVDETESDFAPSKETEDIEEARENPAEPNDIDMADAAMAGQAEDSSKQTDASEAPPDGQMDPVHETPELTSSEVVQEPSEDQGDSDSVPDENVNPSVTQSADEKQHLFARIDGSHSDDGQEFHDASEMPEQIASSPVTRHEESLPSVESHVSDAKQAEEPETTPLEQPKRDNRRKTRTVTAKSLRTNSAKSAAAAKESNSQPDSPPSFRRVSAQRAPSSQRTTRSKTMSFQAAKPKNKKEDISIQIARAALKSPPAKRRRASNTTDTTAATAINPPKRRRVSTTTAPATKPPSTDMVKRLNKAMSNALSLKDMKKCINLRPGQTPPDFVAVATSASPTPTRTPIREYTLLFTITDPSFAPDGVVQVEMFDRRSANFPELEVGDSIILRNFLVVSLRDRGFGLSSRAATGSSWAVFKAGGGNDPQMKTPVEMNAKEKKYLLDLRSWYADLDEDAKDKLTEAAGTMQAAGKESKAKK